jgi:hypothetical protein
MESNRLLPRVTEARNSHTGKGFRYKSLAHFLKRIRRFGRSWLKRTSAPARVVSDNFQLREALGKKFVMKTHLTPAFALVVWHLMIPSGGPTAVLVAAPLSQWSRSATYDSADNCESALTALKNEAFTQAQYDCVSDRSRANLCHDDVANTSSECVSTDDPRLKEE